MEQEQARHVPMEEMGFFKQFVRIADRIWKLVKRWPPLAVDTVGKQMVRAIDRVGATLVGGDGRHSSAEALHFFRIARGSARETRYWIQRSAARDLISAAEANDLMADLISATRQLNSVIRYRRAFASKPNVKESRAEYLDSSSDPFVTD